MEDKAAFLRKLEEELAKIHIRPIEEMEENTDTPIAEHEESECFLAQNPNLDCERTKESAAENLVLTCTILDTAEGFGDLVLVSKTEDLSLPKATQLECTVQPSALDKDGNRTITRVEDASKRPRIKGSVVGHKEKNGSPPAKIPRTEKTGFDAEESVFVQDSEFCSEEGNKSTAAEEDEIDCEEEEDLEEDISSESESEYECKEELMALLLPEEKRELEMLSDVTKLYNKLIEARVEELNSRFRKEIEAHCSSIKQKAVEEITVFKRSSLEVVEEYQRAILVAMKYLEVLLKKVSSYQSAALKWVIHEFRKTEKEVFDKVRERKQMYLHRRARVKKSSHVIHPLLFYFTFVMIMTLYSALIIRLQKLNKEGMS